MTLSGSALECHVSKVLPNCSLDFHLEDPREDLASIKSSSAHNHNKTKQRGKVLSIVFPQNDIKLHIYFVFTVLRRLRSFFPFFVSLAATLPSMKD